MQEYWVNVYECKNKYDDVNFRQYMLGYRKHETALKAACWLNMDINTYLYYARPLYRIHVKMKPNKLEKIILDAQSAVNYPPRMRIRDIGAEAGGMPPIKQ